MKYVSILVGLILSTLVFASTLEEGYSAVRNGNLEEGLSILLPLAEGGDRDAEFAVAILYKEGWGTEKDPAKAFEYYRKSAKQGHVNAMFEMGWAYQTGELIEKDYKKAVEWYQKAADNGHSAAMYGLGGLYYNGMGVKRDETAGTSWYHKSAELGFPPAIQFVEESKKAGLLNAE